MGSYYRGCSWWYRGGAIAGTFGAPVVGTIAGGAAGGAAGASIGEGIEQWLTGKGDWTDVGTSGLVGGVTGGIGGGTLGAVTKFGAKGAAALGGTAGAVEGYKDGGAGGALVGAGLGAVTGGVGGGLLGKGLSKVSQKLGLDKQAKDAVEIGKDFGANYLESQWLSMTGRSAAGQLHRSAAIWQLKRDLANKIFKESKSTLVRSRRRKSLTGAEELNLRKAA